MKDFVSVDLFAGAGGASVGLRRAGFEHRLCVEWDADAAETLVAAGFPGTCGDVRDLSLYKDIERVDLLWASPPCQAFSTAGSRLGALDDRNGWPWTLNIIDHFIERGIGPRYVICENVPGLTYHSADCSGDANKCPGCYWEDWIVPEFQKRFDWVGHIMMNASDYGVPQHRRRVFLVAGTQQIRWPEATHGSLSSTLQGTMFSSPLKPWNTISDALGSGQFLGGGTNPRTSEEREKRSYRNISDEPSTTVAAVQIGNAGPFVAEPDNELSLDSLSKLRRLTWRECAKLQGFPDNHPFQGKTKKSLYRQVGNAVCPQVSEVLGKAVIDAMRN